MGLTDDQFWNMTLKQWMAVVEAHKSKLGFLDSQFASIRYMLYCVNRDPKTAQMNFEDFLMLQQDNKRAVSAEEMEQQLRAISEILQ